MIAAVAERLAGLVAGWSKVPPRGQAGSPADKRVARPLTPVLILVLLGLLLLALTACSGSSPSIPPAAGGAYTSQRYHFSVTYPAGWQATVGQQSSSTIVPLTLVITHVHAASATVAPVSTFTVTVFDAHDANVAASVKALAGDKTLTPITLAGLPAYQGTPIQQPAQGAQGAQINDTHTDYYLPTADYEYQLSTDAVAGDNADAALHSMLASFKLLK